MCGIVGLVGERRDRVLAAMNQLLVHRGPDDAGEYRDDAADVALAMRRLSILDLAGGRQPMSDADGTRWIVHNGEIYNAPELRARLKARGVGFQTSHSDTEVLLHLYDEKGERMVEDLNGMFAFVIYDRRRRRLFGARDRLGIKPFYYLQEGGRFAFASELKVLLALPGVRREIDRASLFHYMSLLYVPGEASIVTGIKRLPPAHLFTYDLATRTLALRPYWTLRFDRAEQRSEDEWARVIRNELGEAVERWTLSDVPVGCSLSGGIDSSAVVGLLAERGARVKTYSLGFAGPNEQEWNELPLSRLVAERWGTEHHELVLKPEELLRDLVRMVWHLDEPYGGGLPSWYVFQFMRQGVTVALTGTGGDELFGNYGKFAAFEEGRVARLAAAGRRLLGTDGRRKSSATRTMRAVVEAVPGRLVGARRKGRLRELAALIDTPLAASHLKMFYYLSDEAKRAAVFEERGVRDVADTASVLERAWRAAKAEDVRDILAHVDITTQLPDEFLFVTDRFSMAHSVEARVPYLDHTFVELVTTIPARVRTRAHDPKYLLKRAVRDLLPDELLRVRKRGFVIPTDLWLRTELRPLAESVLAPERLKRQGILRSDFYDRFVAPHLAGRADHGPQVWAALMFQLWHAVFVEARSTEAPAFSWQDLC